MLLNQNQSKQITALPCAGAQNPHRQSCLSIFMKWWKSARPKRIWYIFSGFSIKIGLPMRLTCSRKLLKALDVAVVHWKNGKNNILDHKRTFVSILEQFFIISHLFLLLSFSLALSLSLSLALSLFLSLFPFLSFSLLCFYEPLGFFLYVTVDKIPKFKSLVPKYLARLQRRVHIFLPIWFEF